MNVKEYTGKTRDDACCLTCDNTHLKEILQDVFTGGEVILMRSWECDKCGNNVADSEQMDEALKKLRQQKALTELTQEAQKMGLYG